MATTNASPFYIPAPFLSVAAYAKQVGESVETVRRDIETGAIPTFQQAKGKKRFVNMVALTKLAESLCEEQKPWDAPQVLSQNNA